MLPQSPPKLLLLDGIGAVATALVMALLIAPFESFFGLPAATAFGLSILGVLFAFYSLSGAARGPSGSRARLRTIAIANLGYCALSVLLMAYHGDVLTPFGYLYLSSEILIVVLLAKYELEVAQSVAET